MYTYHPSIHLLVRNFKLAVETNGQLWMCTTVSREISNSIPYFLLCAAFEPEDMIAFKMSFAANYLAG